MRKCSIAIAVALACIVTPSAQLRVAPVGERPGDVSLDILLRKLASTGTFMETDAHPDDEDNGLLAMLGLGDGMRTALVTATRGDGGQNEIGPELFQSLGVLRTEELLAVHRFDGAEQYFTRAIDFGYSFSVDESIQKWGHDEIVGDFVRHIRTIRPDVIAGFLCGGEGGGQHHQASAKLTLEAFRAAADPTKYPEQIREGLHPWQAKRVFCTDVTAFMPNPPPPTPDELKVDVSGFDPVLGRSYAELGLEARSMHKCQGTSQLLLLPGQSQNRTYKLWDSTLDPKGTAPKRLFDGIDTSLHGLLRVHGPDAPEGLAAGLDRLDADVAQATRAAHATGPAAAIAALAAGLKDVRELRTLVAQRDANKDGAYEIDFRLAQKERQFEDALLVASSIRLDALADDGVVVPGQPVNVTVYATGAAPSHVEGVKLDGFDSGLTGACAGDIDAARAVTCTGAVKIPAGTHLSTPYWTPRTDAARYDFEPDVPFGVPFRPSPFHATFTLTIGGQQVTVDRTVQYRYSDIMAGEKRTQLNVSPPFDVRMDPGIAIVPASSPGRKSVSVTVANNEKGPVSASLSLEVPRGWQVEPASAAVRFAREDETITTKFTVTPAATVTPGQFTIRAVAQAADGARSEMGYQVVEYPHIHRRQVVQDAATRVKVLDVSVAPGTKVGYVMGSGDQVPEAIEQIGATVELLNADDLASGDLSQFDVVMVGVRAYERRDDLRANNQRLLDYARNGGVVIVQYQRGDFNDAQYGPYPAKTSSDRITDETAPLEVLAPANPIFTTPNRIGPGDWAGWVQERGTYFMGQKDTRYVDLLRGSDPFPLNPGAKTGILVEAPVGRGLWIYTGLGVWRQLPAGTDGAYRLLANLISLRVR